MTSAEQLIKQAEISVDQKLYVKASTEYINAIKEDPEAITAELKSKYHEAVDLHQFASALSVGIALLTVDNDNSLFANELGNLARMVGNKDQAYGLYKHALKKDPQNKTPLFNMGSLSANSNRYDREAVSAYNYFPDNLRFVLPDYFIQDDNGTYLSAPNYENDIEKSVLSYKNFKLREKDGVLKDNKKDASGKEIEEKNPDEKQTELTAEDYLDFFDKTALSNDESVSLTLYNKAVYCMKLELYGKVPAIISKINPNFGYPGKYIKLIRAILLINTNQLDGVEEILNELVGSEPYNRLFIVNMGLFLRKVKRVLHSIRYLILGYELLSTSGFHYELRYFLVELHEKINTGGPRIAKLPLTLLYNQGVIDPLLFYNLGLSKVNEKLFVEACELFRKTEECDDSYIAEQANSQIKKIYAYLCEEAENLFKVKKYKAANDLFYTAYLINKNIKIIKRILSVFEYYTIDPKEQEIKVALKRELKFLEEQLAAGNNAEKDRIRTENLHKNHDEYLKSALKNISQKKFHNAIPLLESAFRIKPNKDTFIKLASIYRGLKKNEELFNLANRYKKIIEHQEKVKKFEKESNVKL